MAPYTLNFNQAVFQQIRRTISIVILVAFVTTSIKTPVYAQSVPVSPMPWMSKPGTIVHLSPEFIPAHLKGIVIHPEDALKFDFIVYKGQEKMNDNQAKEEYNKLIKYFMASLAVPDDNQWVNLSPYEKDRIIKDDFGKTEMGRDLLAQDYMLKQITASLIYPEDALGKKFWDKVFTQAQAQFGTTNIPVNTFNKVWILPDDALIYEKGNTAYILKNHLRVMLEEDYLALDKHSGIQSAPAANDTHTVASKIIREIVLPELEREVNEGKNFAALRQVYSGMLLATWYKKALKESLLGKIYANKSKLKGIDQDPKSNEAIYQQYLKAYKKGVFNFIKEDVDRYTQETIPRKYFSGGAQTFSHAAMLGFPVKITGYSTPAQSASISGAMSNTAVVTVLTADSEQLAEAYTAAQIVPPRRSVLEMLEESKPDVNAKVKVKEKEVLLAPEPPELIAQNIYILARTLYQQLQSFNPAADLTTMRAQAITQLTEIKMLYDQLSESVGKARSDRSVGGVEYFVRTNLAEGITRMSTMIQLLGKTELPVEDIQEAVTEFNNGIGDFKTKFSNFKSAITTTEKNIIRNAIQEVREALTEVNLDDDSLNVSNFPSVADLIIRIEQKTIPSIGPNRSDIRRQLEGLVRLLKNSQKIANDDIARSVRAANKGGYQEIVRNIYREAYKATGDGDAKFERSFGKSSVLKGEKVVNLLKEITNPLNAEKNKFDERWVMGGTTWAAENPQENNLLKELEKLIPRIEIENAVAFYAAKTIKEEEIKYALTLEENASLRDLAKSFYGEASRRNMLRIKDDNRGEDFSDGIVKASRDRNKKVIIRYGDPQPEELTLPILYSTVLTTFSYFLLGNIPQFVHTSFVGISNRHRMKVEAILRKDEKWGKVQFSYQSSAAMTVRSADFPLSEGTGYIEVTPPEEKGDMFSFLIEYQYKNPRRSNGLTINLGTNPLVAFQFFLDVEAYLDANLSVFDRLNMSEGISGDTFDALRSKTIEGIIHGRSKEAGLFKAKLRIDGIERREFIGLIRYDEGASKLVDEGGNPIMKEGELILDYTDVSKAMSSKRWVVSIISASALTLAAAVGIYSSYYGNKNTKQDEHKNELNADTKPLNEIAGQTLGQINKTLKQLDELKDLLRSPREELNIPNRIFRDTIDELELTRIKAESEGLKNAFIAAGSSLEKADRFDVLLNFLKKGPFEYTENGIVVRFELQGDGKIKVEISDSERTRSIFYDTVEKIQTAIEIFRRRAERILKEQQEEQKEEQRKQEQKKRKDPQKLASVSGAEGNALNKQDGTSGSRALDRSISDVLTRGGIDFNSANLNLQIKRDGNGVPLPINMQNLENIHIDGLIPVIINIKPALETPLLSELQISKEPQRLAKV